MTDELLKLSVIEKRLTALEREVFALRADSFLGQPHTPPSSKRVSIGCDQPGLILSQAYEVERRSDGGIVCWLGSEGPIQLILPVAPVLPFLCRLIMTPHHKINMTDLRVHVNDAETEYKMLDPVHNESGIYFYGKSTSLRSINITLSGVESVRPVDIGESEDIRLLAFQFSGAEVEFISAEDS